jgi:nitrite reductase/ring-hydroxylating ferredoxin subunit
MFPKRTRQKQMKARINRSMERSPARDSTRRTLPDRISAFFEKSRRSFVANKVKVANVADVVDGAGLQVDAGGKPLALFKVAGKIYAIDNTCLHRGGPLAEGMLQDKSVACPWHGWRFDVTTGQGLTNPAAKLATYEVLVEGADVFVNIP